MARYELTGRSIKLQYGGRKGGKEKRRQ